MKKLLILMMFTGVLASCTRESSCVPTIGAKQKHSKQLRRTRMKLRTNYHYHQTRVGRLFNINVL